MTGLTNSAVNELIEQINASHNNILKVVEEHSILVNKALDLLTTLKNEMPTEIVKVSDPLDELKKVKIDFDDVSILNEKVLSLNTYYIFLRKIVDILSLYEDRKISTTFKQIFVEIFDTCLLKIEYYSWFTDEKVDLESLKFDILKVRDIRWLIASLFCHPKTICLFSDKSVKCMESYGASRDNLLLVKNFIKNIVTDTSSYLSSEHTREDSDKMFTYTLLYGKLDGEVIHYYKDGTIQSKRQYKENVLHGLSQRFHKNGNINVKIMYKDGVIEGERFVYDENGVPILDPIQKAIDLLRKIYIEADMLRLDSSSLKDDLLTELFNVLFNLNDKFTIKFKKMFRQVLDKIVIYGKTRNDLKDKILKMRNIYWVLELVKNLFEYTIEDLEKVKEYEQAYYFIKGKLKLDGEHVDYYNNETIYSRYYLKNGKNEGEKVSYYENGKIRNTENYSENVLQGQIKSYDKEGTISREYNVNKGSLEGDYIVYYKDGSIKSKYHYKNDKQDGEQIECSEDGSITNTYMFKDGVKL
jgi:antitoxin component YwqK of YwqJK toxin-antitoxin module